MADQDIIIVDEQGREHIFPPGMDPKRAAQAVRNTLLQEANAKTLKEPTTFAGGAVRELGRYADELGQQAFESAAHPKTAGDFLGLMLPGSRIPGLRNTAAIPGTSEAIGNRMLRGGARVGAEVLDITPNILKSKAEERLIKGLRDVSQPPARFHEQPLHRQEPYLPQTPGPVRKTTPPRRPEAPPETPFNDKPLYQQEANYPSRPNPERTRFGGPVASGNEAPPTEVPTPFHERPLYQQEPNLPATPAPASGRGGGPIASGVETPPSAVPFHERPLYQQMEELPETPAPVTGRSGMPPVGEVQRSPSDPRAAPRLAGTKAPNLEEVLNEVLTSGMEEGLGKGTLPPSPELTPTAGPFAQSGKFGKSGSLGQPGGYSSGTPSITPGRYDELLGNGFGGAGEGMPLGPEGAPPSGGAATPPGPADLMDPATVAEERRMYGSQAAGQRLGMTPGEVTTLAPGPSRLPLDAEIKMNDARGRAAGATDTSLEELLKQILLARGGS